MQLFVLETGGTINGILDPGAVAPTSSRVAAWLYRHAGRLQLQPQVQIIAMKDSRAIDDDDRQRLAAAVEAAPVQRILIPHGTYTMPETGRYLREHLSEQSLAKSVVLVGSMTPLGEPASDAPAALEFALATLREKPVGVWIAVGGRVWDPHAVVKDPATGNYVPHQRP